MINVTPSHLSVPGKEKKEVLEHAEECRVNIESGTKLPPYAKNEGKKMCESWEALLIKKM